MHPDSQAHGLAWHHIFSCGTASDGHPSASKTVDATGAQRAAIVPSAASAASRNEAGVKGDGGWAAIAPSRAPPPAQSRLRMDIPSLVRAHAAHRACLQVASPTPPQAVARSEPSFTQDKKSLKLTTSTTIGINL